MKNIFKRKIQAETAGDETDVLMLVREIKKSLSIIEKKVDALSGRNIQQNQADRSYSRDRSERDSSVGLSKAVCAECHRECEVPFKPSGNRPVYCKKCFAKREGGSFGDWGNQRPKSREFVQERNEGRKFHKHEGRENRWFGKKR